MQKIVDRSQFYLQIAPLLAGDGGAVSNDHGALELYSSDPKVSEDEDAAHGIAGSVSLNVGGHSRART